MMELTAINLPFYLFISRKFMTVVYVNVKRERRLFRLKMKIVKEYYSVCETIRIITSMIIVTGYCSVNNQ